ncbi:MAG: hypothetical protein H0U73_03310 [Tatlockia sp.]|nr:hypothetical protein [Tatlockia sp.]
MQLTFPEVNEINTIYGFGSFFRNHTYNDIDLLIVANKNCFELLKLYRDTEMKIKMIFLEFNSKLDITFLTINEFEDRPLIHMDSLVMLYH